MTFSPQIHPYSSFESTLGRTDRRTDDLLWRCVVAFENRPIPFHREAPAHPPPRRPGAIPSWRRCFCGKAVCPRHFSSRSRWVASDRARSNPASAHPGTNQSPSGGNQSGHYGRKQSRIQTEVLGHSLVHSLVRLLPLVPLVSAGLTHSLARSLCSLLRSWDS